jgi:hypothetical protein
VIVLDFETNVETGEPVVLTFRPTGEPIQVATGRERMAEVSARALADQCWAFNAAFDAGCMAQLVGARAVWEAYDRGNVLCALTGAVLRDIRTDGEPNPRGYALDQVCQRFGLPVEPDKQNPWRLRYGSLANTPITAWPIEALRYLRDDVSALDHLVPAVAEERDLARQSIHDWWLSHPGRTGVRTDAARVAVLAERVRRECAEAQAACGPIFRPNGSRDMKALHAAAEAAGVTARTAPSARFPAGQLQVTQETIEGLDHPVLAAYSRFLTLDAHRSRLLPQLERERVTCRYRLAATGRAIASGAKGRDAAGKQITIGTNIQNLPKKGGWRECLIPDADDHVWIVADFTGLELGTFAEILDHRYGCSTLAASLRAGIDGHLAMAAQLAGCSLASMVAAYRGELGAEARAFADLMRQTAKGPNFGFPGGLGPGGFVAYMRAMGQRLELAEAARLRAAWLASDPTYGRYLDDAGIAARMQAPIIGYRSGLVRASTRYTEHANTPFQELGASLAKAAGYAISRACVLDIGPLGGCRVAIFAHDEFVISAPRSRAPEAAEQVKELCRDTASRFLSHVPMHADPLLVPRWSKSAKPKRGPDGALIVTEVS